MRGGGSSSLLLLEVEGTAGGYTEVVKGLAEVVVDCNKSQVIERMRETADSEVEYAYWLLAPRANLRLLLRLLLPSPDTT